MSPPGLEQLRTELERCPFHTFLRPEAVSATPSVGTVEVRLPYRPEFSLGFHCDVFHGGVVAALIDLTGHAVVAVESGRVSPTIDLRIDYLTRATGRSLLATGRVLRAGRSITRADVEVRDLDGVLVAVGRGTFSRAGVGRPTAAAVNR